MKRLTFEGNFCDISMCRENPCPYNGSCSQKETWLRLKEYEDREEQGRLVERERGEWRKTQEPLGWEDVECIECPVCHQSWIVEDEYGFPDWSFCPACGADMRPEGGADEGC